MAQTPNTPNSSERERSGTSSMKEQNEREQRDAMRSPQRQDDDVEETSDADGVEIGDPVPEGDRTIRASRPGTSETGEDEDLPPDDGDIEGGSARH
jgi:hypothetical protein